MDKDVATHIAKVAFKASADLGELVPLAKAHCTKNEYETLGRAIALASATISLEILNLIFREFPEIKQNFDEDIKLYGRIL
jgi:hypothetical protein